MTNTTNIFEMEVHPANSVWPMVSDEDLEEWAIGIKRDGGLIHPIVVKDGVLIDGKCRRAACKIAGVTPETVELGDDIDPDTYNWCMNALRQSFSPSQRAMGKAMLSDEGENEGSNLKKARYVLAHSPDRAELIMKTGAFLEESYAKLKKQEAASKLHSEKTAWLRKENPALLEMVQADRFTLDAAIKLERESNDAIMPWEAQIIESEGEKLKTAFDDEYKNALAGMSKTAASQTRNAIEKLSKSLVTAARLQAMEMLRKSLKS